MEGKSGEFVTHSTDREDDISDTLFMSHVESKTGHFEIVVMSLERFNAQLKVKTANYEAFWQQNQLSSLAGS